MLGRFGGPASDTCGFSVLKHRLMVSVACPPLITYALYMYVTFSLYYGSLWQSCCGHVWFIYPIWHCLMVSTVFLSYLLLQFIHSWTDQVVLPYSRVVLLSFGIVPWCMWHLHLLCPYCTTPPPPCSADSHLSGCTIATMSCWVDLVVLPQIPEDYFSFSSFSWYLWHVHHCWPMHSMSHFQCIMDHFGSRAVDTCGLYILWHCLMVSTAFLSYLLLQFNHS